MIRPLLYLSQLVQQQPATLAVPLVVALLSWGNGVEKTIGEYHARQAHDEAVISDLREMVVEDKKEFRSELGATRDREQALGDQLGTTNQQLGIITERLNNLLRILKQ